MKKATKPTKTLKTSISIPSDLYQEALKRAAYDRRTFSGYVQALIDQDTKSQPASR